MIPFPATTCAFESQRDQRVRARQVEQAGWGGNVKLEILLPCNPGPGFLYPALKFQVVRGVVWLAW